MTDTVRVRACSSSGRADHSGRDDEVLYLRRDKYVGILKQRYPSWHKVFTNRRTQDSDPFPYLAGITFPQLIDLLSSETPSPHSIISVGGLREIIPNNEVHFVNCGFREEDVPDQVGRYGRKQLWTLMSEKEVQHLQRDGFLFNWKNPTLSSIDVFRDREGFDIDPPTKLIVSFEKMDARKFNQIRQAHSGLIYFGDLSPEVSALFNLMLDNFTPLPLIYADAVAARAIAEAEAARAAERHMAERLKQAENRIAHLLAGAAADQRKRRAP